ncbi:hypothetical protein Pan5_66 [Pseudanabaena phage Pan5]|nr:hypothetical protein Pan5_66 [Pseudanabaena phage Pan5]
MISKKELLQKANELTNNNLLLHESWNDLMQFIHSLPDDKPDLLPFQWPIPDGMDVVTRDGREVEQLKHFDFEGGRIIGVAGDTMVTSNKYGINTFGSTHSDLFLRWKEKKVWVVEYDDEIGVASYDSLEAAIANTAKGTPIYEATLKPVV